MPATLPCLTRKMIELTPVRLMRVVKKTKARAHTSLIKLTMVIRHAVILADYPGSNPGSNPGRLCKARRNF